MQTKDIKVNPNFSQRLYYIGEEKTCVVVCDDVLEDLSAVRDIAISASKFEHESNTSYPGQRAELARSYAESVFPLVVSLIRQNYALPHSSLAHLNAGYFSIVTLAPEDLSLQQRIPHFDSTNPYFFAAMQYINEGDFGGTSFYSHRPTGFENITVDRTDKLIQSAQSLIQKSPPKQDYFYESDDHFLRLGTVDHKANRLVIYPGTLLHSGNIRSAKDINSDPATGRLTTNLFIEFR
ncbi:MAG: DUF6445 family protein [Gammaproteobacteria bacterium]|nr:DUF6445 family protein [Gammaproteobacteria bacterium]MDH5302696.1 DUF6445 family protein [Gammaproteobacteria bacterium]MDH5320868.1 DUF6445 family protein [Gammaproteobacteria bacterium]